jgi:hypothetical protein
MSNDLVLQDPSKLGWPPMLPFELALRETAPRELCESYGIDQIEWDRLRADPLFIAAVKGAVDELRHDGVSFRVKARLQSEMLLQKSFEMIQAPYDQVPAAVKADLIKHTVRVAGLDASRDQGAGAGAGVIAALKIDINL